jgi:hypothetical protein
MLLPRGSIRGRAHNNIQVIAAIPGNKKSVTGEPHPFAVPSALK